MEYKMFLDKKNIMKSNIKKSYSLVWGQCTQALQLEIMGISKFEDKDKEADSEWLLKN